MRTAWNGRMRHAIVSLATLASLVLGGCTGGDGLPSSSSPQSPSGDTSRGSGTVPEYQPGSSFTSVDGSSPSDVWAVGEEHGRNARWHSLAAHWDGSAWQLVTVPDVGRLAGVDVTAPDDAWALGEHDLIHWNGASWSAVALPRGHGAYSSVAATGPNDVWIGGVRPGPMITPHSRGWATGVAHYDGQHWTLTDTPSPGTRNNSVGGIVALSPTDVWAGGYFEDLGKGMPEGEALTMHWNGERWWIVDTPNPSRSLNVIWSMGADDTGAAWALGHYRGDDHHLHPLMLRWDGRTWSTAVLEGASLWSAQAVDGAPDGPTWIVGSPATSSFAIARCTEAACQTTLQPTNSNDSASSVYAATPDEAWAVGTSWTDGSSPFIERWDGTSWERAPFPPIVP